jgi:outer membrane lipase/esterase
MAFPWLRRAALLAACGASLLLAACGSGNIESQFNPTRIVAFGDGFADLGQNGNRYTVNNGSINNWTQYVATAYKVPLTASATGGTSYASGNARVAAKPDAAGNSATPTVQEQVDRFLGTGRFGSGDLVIVNAGTADIVTQGALAAAGSLNRTQLLAATEQAGRDLGGQVRRIVQNGATHVLVVGPYNLGRSPWATAVNQATLLQEASSRFNEEFLVTVVDLGATVLYVDAGFYYNLATSAPGSYELSNVTTPVCTSADAGAGIGIGPGQVNSNLCTATTVLAGANVDQYLFADRVYPTPKGHRLFGEYAYNRIRERW